MDWDRKKQLVSSDDKVHIVKDDMVTTAEGVQGEPALNKVTLDKDVTVNITPQDKEAASAGAQKNKITITCDGPLSVDYEKSIATFNNNVKVTSSGTEIYSDVMDVYFSQGGKKQDATDQSPALVGNKIDKISARGNVKIVRGENISFSEEAIYNGIDKKITLLGRPRLIIYSTEDLGASTGN
jgi:lipopolysaccharide export system protein LptC